MSNKWLGQGDGPESAAEEEDEEEGFTEQRLLMD